MHVFKSILWFLLAVVVMLAVLIMGGCTTKVNYSYDLGMSFAGFKSYKWDCSMECPTDSKTACTPALARKDSLVESNVRFIADQVLKEKGYTKTCDKPDLVIAIDYDCEMGSYQRGYQLRMLALNISRTEKEKPPIWQGMAYGTINTAASSSALKKIVQDILSKFPPK